MKLQKKPFHLRLWDITKLDFRFLLRRRVPFFICLSFNLLLYFSCYQVIYKKDSVLYPTTIVLSLSAIVLWSIAVSMIPWRASAFLRHSVCLLLPYIVFAADYFNGHHKNMAYFLSQFFFYFSLGAFFLLVDIALENVLSINKYVKIGIVSIWRIWTGFLFLFFLLVFFNTLSGNISLDYNAIMAICQTNYEEARGYFTRLNHRYLLLSLTIVSFTIVLVLNHFPFRYMWSRRRSVFCLSLLACSAVFFVSMEIAANSSLYSSNMFKLITSPISYVKENRNFKKNRSNYEEFLRQQFQDEPLNPSAEGVYVIIIGESLNRHYMSLYDYDEYDTTPFQKELKERYSLTVFQRPFSAFAQTIRCLAYMLTNQNQYDNKDKKLNNSVSLFDVARYNGFTTRWFTAQGNSLFLDSPTAVLAGSAQYQFSLPMVRSRIDHRITDADLLPFFPEQLTQKELIVIQLMGSHSPYSDVYPPDYMDDSQLSIYVKSVCYNDLVMKQLFDYFHKRNASVILYLSDHSEDVANDLAHDPRLEVFTQVMTEIPFWLYVSPEYLSKNPELEKQLNRAADRVFTGDLLFDLVLSLMHLNSSFTRSENNILSDDYFLDESNAMTLGGKYKLKF